MTHTCPRRMNEYGPWEREEDLDTYEPNHGLVGQPRGCSFCGSLPPDDFMDHVRAGRPIGPTDKSYKLYVHEIPRSGDPNDLRVLGHSTHPGDRYRPWSELTEAEQACARAYSSHPASRPPEEGGWMFTTWGETVEGKFYTSHLSPEQGREFWRLHLDGKVNWSHPLYRPLYLPGASEDAAATADPKP